MVRMWIGRHWRRVAWSTGLILLFLITAAFVYVYWQGRTNSIKIVRYTNGQPREALIVNVGYIERPDTPDPEYFRLAIGDSRQSGFRIGRLFSQPYDYFVERFGFSLRLTNSSRAFVGSLRVSPWWVVGSLIPAWIAMIGLPFYRRSRRRRRGLCVRCAYDLAGCVERCPECGEGISKLPEKK